METNTAPQDPTAQAQPVSDQPTAETDAKCGSAYEFQYSTEVVCADFARTLERQRDAAIKVCQEWDKLSIELIAERDAARAELERVKQALGIAERAMTHAGDDLAQLRADLAATREESEDWERIHAGRYEEIVALRNEKAALTARAVEAEREREVMHGHLGEMLDEIRTTERGHWPHHLFCVECGCNVSKVEPHDPACKIGLAIAAWDVIDAARVAGLPGDGEGN